LAEEGFQATAFEEHSTIGRPVQCAGLISSSGVEDLGLRLDNATVNQVRGAKIFSPGGESLTVERKETVAFVVDRFTFDQNLYKKAKRLGVEVKTDSKLIDIRNNSLFMQSQGHGELVKSQITVGADGANSIVRHALFPEIKESSFVQGFQIKAQGHFDKNLVELHFGEFAPGFFAWLVPESSTVARIGLGVKLGQSASKGLQQFIQQRQLKIKTVSKSAGLIPISQPPKELVKGNVLLVGDAAAQTKATSGGGLIFGLKAAETCAETVATHIKHKQGLNSYLRNLAEINKELGLHWKIYSYLQGLKPEKFDTLFAKAREAGIEQFLEEYGDMDKPGTFMRKMLLKPKMWGLLPAMLKVGASPSNAENNLREEGKQGH
jgi:geranylgeranyl reductase family protein